MAYLGQRKQRKTKGMLLPVHDCHHSSPPPPSPMCYVLTVDKCTPRSKVFFSNLIFLRKALDLHSCTKPLFSDEKSLILKGSAKSSVGSYRRKLLLMASVGRHFEPSVHQKHRDPLFADCISYQVHHLIWYPFKLRAISFPFKLT